MTSEERLSADDVRTCRRCLKPLAIVKLMYGSVWSHPDTRRDYCVCPSCGTLNDPDFPDTRCDYCAEPLAARTDGDVSG